LDKFVKGAKVKAPVEPELTASEAMFCAITLYCKENPNTSQRDWLYFCATAWTANKLVEKAVAAGELNG